MSSAPPAAAPTGEYQIPPPPDAATTQPPAHSTDVPASESSPAPGQQLAEDLAPAEKLDDIPGPPPLPDVPPDGTDQSQRWIDEAHTRLGMAAGYRVELHARFRDESTVRQQSVIIRGHTKTGRVLYEWLDSERFGRRMACEREGDSMTVIGGVADGPDLSDVVTLPRTHPLMRDGWPRDLLDMTPTAWVEYLRRVQSAGPGGGSVITLVSQTARIEGIAHPVVELRQSPTAADVESGIPSGGCRNFYFDPATFLPLRVVTQDASGEVIEAYDFQKLKLPREMNPEDLQLP